MAPAISTPEAGASSAPDTPMLDANAESSSEVPDGPSEQNATVCAAARGDPV